MFQQPKHTPYTILTSIAIFCEWLIACMHVYTCTSAGFEVSVTAAEVLVARRLHISNPKLACKAKRYPNI